MIVATEDAKQTLERLREKYGAIILHVAGGWSKTPVCLKIHEFRLGSRDILLGSVSGVDVYEMQITPTPLQQDDDYVLDVTSGLPVGFSLDIGDGKKFTIERRPAKQDTSTDL